MKFLNGLTPSFDLTYDDVFMVPSRSSVGSRMGVDLATDDGTGTTIPLVVANMTAVAGKRMAETVARRGGLTIIPQDIPVDVVMDTVSQVKASHLVYDTPVTVKPHHTCGYAMGLIPKRSHGAAVVVDPETDRPVGIVDLSDASDVDRFTQVRAVMSTELVTLPEGIDAREAFDRLKAARRRMAPVVDAEGRLVGVLTRAGAVRSTIYRPAVDAAGRLRIGAAIGMNGDPAGRATELVEAGVDVIVVDTAHGHQDRMLDAVAAVRAALPEGLPIATSPPPAPPSSRSGSARAPCAPPACRPVWAAPSSPPFWSAPAPPTSSAPPCGPTAACATPATSPSRSLPGPRTS